MLARKSVNSPFVTGLLLFCVGLNSDPSGAAAPSALAAALLSCTCDVSSVAKMRQIIVVALFFENIFVLFDFFNCFDENLWCLIDKSTNFYSETTLL